MSIVPSFTDAGLTDLDTMLWIILTLTLLSDYVVSEAQIIQPQTTVYGQVESERSISVFYIF
jgi:hypothetical protein